MTAILPRPDYALRRMVLAAVLLFAQLVSPAMALGMLQAAGPVTAVCRADGTVDTMPEQQGQHATCAVCPACHAPSPVLSGPPQLPAPPALHVARAAMPPVASAPPHPRRLDAQPRGPPASPV